MLSQLERPLLCTSAHVEEQEQLEIPEAAMFMDLYAGQGLDFVVDSGQRVRPAFQLAKMCLLLCPVVSEFVCFLEISVEQQASGCSRTCLCAADSRRLDCHRYDRA